MTNLYDKYHKKNVNIQNKLINKNNFTYRYLINTLDSVLKPSSVVLDVGCGVGTIDFYISNKVKKVVGVDISSRAISLANESKNSMKLNNIDFFVGDEKDILKNLENNFDLVICSEVIEHVKNDNGLVKSISSKLNKNGVLVLSTPLKTAPLYRWGYLNAFDKNVGHLRRYDYKTLKEIIESNGFKILKINETEGLIRNFLFTNNKYGWILKVYKWPFYYLSELLDLFLSNLFGFSNIYIVAIKK